MKGESSKLLVSQLARQVHKAFTRVHFECVEEQLAGASVSAFKRSRDKQIAQELLLQSILQPFLSESVPYLS